MAKKAVLCITGASGSIYGYRLLEVLDGMGFNLDLIVSTAGAVVLKEELGLSLKDIQQRFPRVRLVSEKAIADSVASGSRLINYTGVLVAPCSMSTLACVANGINQNLIHRVCETALKERVPLVLIVREAPYSLIHLENMLKVARAGATILPASPAFYHKPKSVEEIVDFIVGKALDNLRIEHNLYKRWKSQD
ncbi:UbiX family flavin prenyltransferase [Thermocrinis sp.]